MEIIGSNFTGLLGGLSEVTLDNILNKCVANVCYLGHLNTTVMALLIPENWTSGKVLAKLGT